MSVVRERCCGAGIPADPTDPAVGPQPRYMQRLLASAEQRRHQHERRVERQVQREREEEGDEFADKEAFVTAAYRQRLLEREKEEEQERRTKRIEGEQPRHFYTE